MLRESKFIPRSIGEINRSPTFQIKLGESALVLAAYHAYLAAHLERLNSGISAGVLLGVSLFSLREGILQRRQSSQGVVDVTGDASLANRATDILAEL